MNTVTTDRLKEIVIRVIPSHLDMSEEARPRSVRSSSQEPIGSYDALIYTNLNIRGLEHPASSFPGQPRVIAKLPLAAVEHLEVHWGSYREYLAAFIEGEKAAQFMRNRLLETLSHGLKRILFGGIQYLDRFQPVRIWWSSDTPELEDLPWELITDPGYSSRSKLFSFVRGLPSETPVPRVPLIGPLRLAFIYKQGSVPKALLEALDNLLPTDIQVIRMTGSPYKALLQAVHEGYELVHFVADGTVSLAYEGILQLHDPAKPELAPAELSTLLCGSRVSVLSLTERKSSRAATFKIGNHAVPSAYRAFVYLGNSHLPLPNIVVPLGPISDQQMNRFWYNFYTSLAKTLQIENAIVLGRSEELRVPVAIALFLRQQHIQTFQRLEPPHDLPAEDPTLMNATLQVSRDMVEQLRALGTKYGGLPDSVNRFIDTEGARQEQLVTKLSPWTQVQEGEDG